MGMSIQHWAKTQEGVEVIDSQKPFCIDGTLWQGYQKVAVRVHDDQLSDDEMEQVRDVDNTMQRVWFVRRQRLEARVSRKMDEYDTRRQALRAQRNELIQAIKNNAELGIKRSPDDDAQLDRIDQRLARLVDGSKSEQLKLARAKEDPETAAKEAEERHLAPVQCVCGAISPEGHKNPSKWLTGHSIHCKSRKKSA
jgi:hypothetical protein